VPCKKTPPFDVYKESPKAGGWQVRKRNGTVTLVEHRMMAFSQYFHGVEKAAQAREMNLYFPEK
jgi:hypothetical protein